MPHTYVPLKLPRFSHLEEDEIVKIFKEGAVPENCDCDEKLLKFVRADGSVFGKEHVVDGKKRLKILNPRYS